MASPMKFVSIKGRCVVEPHFAVPYTLDGSGEPVALYGKVCKGANPRLGLDMWKLAFEFFIHHHGRPPSEICRRIVAEVKRWPGLDEPQFLRRSLNSAHMWAEFPRLPRRRPESFLNILPAPVDTADREDLSMFGIFAASEGDRLDHMRRVMRGERTFNAVEEIYGGEAMYCSGGHSIDVRAALAAGRVWFKRDNTPAREFVGEGKRYRLREVRDEIADYFNHPELKSRGATADHSGPLAPRHFRSWGMST